MRGLAYYSDFIVETNLNFKVTNNKGKEIELGSICSGGSYSKLISRFRGVDVPGTGISFGVDRLLFALSQLNQIKVEDQKPVLVCVMDQKFLKNYYEIVDLLRENNINAEVFLNTKKNLGKQLDLANKRELDVAIICGENEFKDNTVTIKNLKGIKGENSQTIPKLNLINEIKNLSDKILRSVKSRGFKYIDLPSVIEADHIVQRSGENFRKFIFSFTDQNGSELCLRPDLTIASCLRYLENNLKGKEKIFYSGQAYRKSQNKKDSIIRNQIGFEIIGSQDEKNDDKEIINTSLKSLKDFKYSSGTLTVGNVEIFNLLISKLDIPKRWKLRLSRHFWREDYFNDLLERLETNSDVDPTIVEVDKKRYLKMLKDDQSSIVAGRTIKRNFRKI